MKLLHTGDWHLGKVLKGVARLPEQELVLAEIVEVARREAVDAVLVAGDVFDTAAPAADAQRVAWGTLLGFRSLGAEVLVIAGNHDHAEGFDALSPVLRAAGITVVGRPRRPAEGGLLELSVGGGSLRVAMVPFVSQRGVVRAAELLELDAAQMSQSYSDRLTRVIRTLGAGFADDAVNVVLAHAMVRGGTMGGGERDAQTVFEYGIDTMAFDPSTSYVALGHLHRQQQLPGPCPVWYSGSPIAVDFGEHRNLPGVLVVEAEPGRPATARPVPLHSPRGLVTLTDTVEGLRAIAPTLGDELVKVVVTEPARAGLAEEVRAILPNAVDIRVQAPVAGSGGDAVGPPPSRLGASPHDQFSRYLREQHVADERLSALFAALLDEELAARRQEGAA